MNIGFDPGRKKLTPSFFFGNTGSGKLTVFRDNLKPEEMPPFLVCNCRNRASSEAGIKAQILRSAGIGKDLLDQ